MKFSLLALIIALPLLLSAQIYLPATLVLRNGETVKGDLLYQNWSGIQKLRVQLPDKKEATFLPYDVQHFEITRYDQVKEEYISRIVRVNKSTDELLTLEDTHIPLMKTDTVLLRVVVRGTVSLYEFKDLKGRDHFFIGRDTIEELIYKRFMKSGQVLENKQYLEQVLRYFTGCAPVLNQLPYLGYEETGFRKVFIQADSCGLIKIDHVVMPERYRMEWHLSGGITSTHLSFSDNPLFVGGFSAYNYREVGVRPMIGLTLMWYIHSSSRHLAILNEIGYRSFHLQGTFFYPPAQTSKGDIQKGLIKDCVLLRYFIFNRNPERAFFLEGGLYYGRFIWEKSNKTVTLFQYVDSMPMETADNKMDLGAALGLGYKWKRIALEGRFEFGNTGSHTPSLPRTHNNVLLLKANYRLR
jgi:hypothetical protein